MGTTRKPSALGTSIPPTRDLTLDLARVACVMVVLVMHLLQTGIGTTPDGRLVASFPLERQPWFAAASWVGQIMPLFFVVGGFAAALGWRSAQLRGTTPNGFIRARVLRLTQPSLPLFLFFAVVLTVVSFLPVPTALVADAAVGAGSPLWFLAAYLLCQTAVPSMMRLHTSAPRTTIAVLAALVVAVDVARFTTGERDIGLLNLAFVWILVQQIGFWYADGWFDRRTPLALVAIVAGCYLALGALTAWGPYNNNMLYNLNPATLPLVLLGLAQACLLRLLRRPLTRLMETRSVRAFVLFTGSRLMTIYLWHLPVILFVKGIELALPGLSPNPETAAWWWSRLPVLAVVLAVLYVVTLLLARWEVIGPLPPAPAKAIVAAAWVLVFIPPFGVMWFGLDLWWALLGALSYAIAVPLLRSSIGLKTPSTFFRAPS